MQSDIYKEYMASETSSYEEDRELWRKLYKKIIFNNTALDEVLEDQSLYWNDDKEIVDTFVLKTIKRFNPENGENRNFFLNLRMKKIRTSLAVCSAVLSWMQIITVI